MANNTFSNFPFGLIAGDKTKFSDGSTSDPSLTFSSNATAGLFLDTSGSSNAVSIVESGVSGWFVQPAPVVGGNFAGPGSTDIYIGPWNSNTSGIGVVNNSTSPGTPVLQPSPFNIGYFGDGGLFVGSASFISGSLFSAPIFAVIAPNISVPFYEQQAFSVGNPSGCTRVHQGFASNPIADSTITLSNGGSATIADITFIQVLTGSGTVASFTLTLPANPEPGQIIGITTNQTITSLTLSPNSGQSIVGTYTTLVVGTALRFIYAGSGTAWYPI